MSDLINGKPVSDYSLAELWSFLEDELRQLQTRSQALRQDLALIEYIAHEVFERARRVPRAWKDRIADTDN